MKYIPSVLALLLLCNDGALALPLRKRDSVPFGLLTVQSDDPALDNRIVSTMSIDGTLWINAGSRAFLGIVRSNATLQEFGTDDFLSIDTASSQLEIGFRSDDKFAIEDDILRVDGDSEVIACQQFKNAYQLFKKQANFTCIDEMGQPAKSASVGLRALELSYSLGSDTYPPPMDADCDGEDDSDSNSGYFPPGVYPPGSDDDYTYDDGTPTFAGNATYDGAATTMAWIQRRDLDVVIPLPYDVNLTVTMTPGQTAVSAGLIVPVGTGTKQQHVATAAAAATTASKAMVTPSAAVETAQVGQTAWPTATVVPMAEESIAEMDHKDGPSLDHKDATLIGPSYFVGEGDDEKPVVIKSPTMGKVETYAEYRAITYAAFDVPADVSYSSCNLVFEDANPSFTPVSAGDKTFEVWTLDSEITADTSAVSMPNINEKVAIFDSNSLKSTGVPLLCTSGHPVQVAFVPTANATNSSVVWFQQNGAGFKLALNH